MPALEEWIRPYSSPNHQIRLRSAKGILQRGGEAPLDLLIYILLNYCDEGLGAATEKVLLKRRDPDLWPKMIGLLKSKNDFAREVACRVLGESGDQTVATHLLPLIYYPNGWVRRVASLALMSLGERSTITAMKKWYDMYPPEDLIVSISLKKAVQKLDLE